MLHYETIEPGTLELLKKLQGVELLKETRLVGGTSLALQLGHRKSVDLDLFGHLECEPEELVESLQKIGNVIVTRQTANIHLFQIDQIKVDIVNYNYPWIHDMLYEDGIRLAHTEDIAALKINAIINRGTKKDFIDIAQLLEVYSLQQILEFYSKKFPNYSNFMAMKSLTYFEDAEQQPMPYMFSNKSWEDVKSEVLSALKQ